MKSTEIIFSFEKSETSIWHVIANKLRMSQCAHRRLKNKPEISPLEKPNTKQNLFIKTNAGTLYQQFVFLDKKLLMMENRSNTLIDSQNTITQFAANKISNQQRSWPNSLKIVPMPHWNLCGTYVSTALGCHIENYLCSAWHCCSSSDFQNLVSFHYQV